MTEASTRDQPDGAAASSPTVAAVPASPPRRMLAFLVDLITAGLPLWVVGAAFFEPMSDLGDSGVLIGWAVVLVYFGFFDSALGNGRSPGKSPLGIAVVAADGTLLSPLKAAARALLVTAPLFFDSLSIGTSNPVVTGLLALVVSGLWWSTIYLTVFNRRTGQALHDVMVGAVVVRGQGPLPVLPPIWGGHWVVVGSILLLSVAIPTADFLSGGVDEHEVVQHEVERLPFVGRAEVVSETTKCDTCKDRRETKVVSVKIVLRRPPADRDAALRQVVDTVFSTNQPFVNEGRLRIVFTRGFNFFIAKFSKSEAASTDVAQWRASKYPQWSAGKDPQWRAGIGSGRVLSIGVQN